MMKTSLNKFVNSWCSKKNVIGILLTGSYSVGLQNENSDIDIRIIFSDKTKKSIKGTVTIDGYVFSYMGRSSYAIKRKMNAEFINYNKFEARLFGIGRILYDREGKLNDLIQVAQYYLNTPFLIKDNNIQEVKTTIYGIYSYVNYLNTLEEDSPFFNYTYYLFMKQVLRFYSSYLGFEFFLDVKTEKVLLDPIYANTYSWQKFPDQDFVKLWHSSLSKENVNKKSVNILFSYLQENTKKIDINKFKIIWSE